MGSLGSLYGIIDHSVYYKNIDNLLPVDILFHFRKKSCIITSTMLQEVEHHLLSIDGTKQFQPDLDRGEEIAHQIFHKINSGIIRTPDMYVFPLKVNGSNPVELYPGGFIPAAIVIDTEIFETQDPFNPMAIQSLEDLANLCVYAVENQYNPQATAYLNLRSRLAQFGLGIQPLGAQAPKAFIRRTYDETSLKQNRLRQQQVWIPVSIMNDSDRTISGIDTFLPNNSFRGFPHFVFGQFVFLNPEKYCTPAELSQNNFYKTIHPEAEIMIIENGEALIDLPIETYYEFLGEPRSLKELLQLDSHRDRNVLDERLGLITVTKERVEEILAGEDEAKLMIGAVENLCIPPEYCGIVQPQQISNQDGSFQVGIHTSARLLNPHKDKEDKRNIRLEIYPLKRKLEDGIQSDGQMPTHVQIRLVKI